MPNDPLYGFVNLQHLWDERVTAVDVAVIDSAIQQSVDEHNRQLNALLDLFVERTTEFKTKFKTATQTRNQPLDDDGRARPIQVAGQYELAFPLQESGNAWGANWISRQKMTVAEANRITATLLEGDVRWTRDHILAALFADTPWTFDDEHGDLTIKGLANGDSDEYLIVEGGDTPATDDHYAAQADPIDDAHDPFPAMYEDLVEHPENSGEPIALIPTNQHSAVKNLSDFYPVSDPNIRQGSGSAELVGSLGVTVPGQVFGYHDSGVWLVHWRSMPASTIVGLMPGGDRPLRMREQPEPDLRGFIRVAERTDHPFWEAQYVRYAGFGAWNRVGAYVIRVGNATYAVPTGYDSPMA